MSEPFIKPSNTMNMEDLYKIVAEMVKPTDDMEKQALQCICGLYASKDLPLGGMRNWSRMDYNRWKYEKDTLHDGYKAGKNSRSIRLGCMMVNNDFSAKVKSM